MRKSLLPGLVPVVLGLGACAGPTFGAVDDDAEAGALSIDGVAVESDEVFGYRRAIRVDGLGVVSVVYVRTDPDGCEVEVDRAAYERRVKVSAARMAEALPAACAGWIERCPELCDAVLDRIEEGASYRGASDAVSSGVVGPYFWTGPAMVEHGLKCAHARDVVDLLDTLFAFLVAADRAAKADEPAGATREERALAQAECLMRVVDIVRASAACLGIDVLPAAGPAYRHWAERIDAAGGDAGALAEALVAEVGRE